MRTSRWLLLATLMSCGDQDQGTGRAALRERAVEGPVVARVNGDPVTLADVELLSASAGLDAKQALARLVEERLLAQHAETRGYGDLHSVRIELKRARVRALLEQAVEAETGPETFSEKQVEERFARVKSRLTPRIRVPYRPFDVATGELSHPSGGPLLADYEGELREQLSRELRREKLAALLKELRGQTRVVYEEQAIQQALSDESAAGTGT